MDEIVSKAISTVYCAMEKKKGREKATSVCLFLSGREVEALAGQLHDNWAKISNDTKYVTEALSGFGEKIKDAYAADIAMFGRMLAERPSLNQDAACQVAQAISTNAVNMEIDFFTAVDDIQPQGETGADMMGVIEYNSSCFYRYASLDVDQLMKNLRNDRELADRSVRGFVRAFILAIPTGKQTSMAAQNPPSFVMVVLKDGAQPWSLANAFVKPISPKHQKDLVEGSIEALDKYWGDLCIAYGTDGIKHYATCQIGVDAINNLRHVETRSIDELVAKTIEQVEFRDVAL